jgi:hypothetical protein
VYGVIGDRFEIMPIPLVHEATTYFDAGALRIGVEGRAIDDEVVSTGLGDLTAGQAEELRVNQPADLDDSGPSVHVIEAETGVEHLRFDCFDHGPHYHYVLPDQGYQVIVTMDVAACGDPIEFAMECLRSRLRPMLQAAGRDDLAQSVDDHVIEQVVPSVQQLARKIAAA